MTAYAGNHDLVVEPTADIDASATLGAGTKVWHLAQIRENARLGCDCIVGRGAYVGPGVTLGNKVKLQNYALVYEPARLEDAVFIGPAAVLTNDLFPRSVDVMGALKRPGSWTASGVVVREGASVGARAVILPGCVIGRWAMIAAGAVVTRDVPDFALLIGVPARHVGWVGRAGGRLIQGEDARWYCPQTGERYAESAGRLELLNDGLPVRSGRGRRAAVDGLPEHPDSRMAQVAKRPWQEAARHRRDAHSDDVLDAEPEIALQGTRQRRDGESPDMIPVADVQRGRLAAGQQQQAVVRGCQVRHGEDQVSRGPDDPAHLAKGRHDVLHGDKLTIPDHDIEVTLGCRQPAGLEVRFLELGHLFGVWIASIDLIVDDRPLRPGELFTEEQDLGTVRWLDLQQAAAGRCQTADRKSDFPGHGQLNQAVPAISRGGAAH